MNQIELRFKDVRLVTAVSFGFNQKKKCFSHIFVLPNKLLSAASLTQFLMCLPCVGGLTRWRLAVFVKCLRSLQEFSAAASVTKGHCRAINPLVHLRRHGRIPPSIDSPPRRLLSRVGGFFFFQSERWNVISLPAGDGAALTHRPAESSVYAFEESVEFVDVETWLALIVGGSVRCLPRVSICSVTLWRKKPFTCEK